MNSFRCYKLFKFPVIPKQIRVLALNLEYKATLKGLEIKYAQWCAAHTDPA